PILDVQVWKPSKPFKNTGEALVQGLEDELMVPQKAKGNARFGCVWRQGNASSTRKQVAPLIVSEVACARESDFIDGVPFSALQKDTIESIPASKGS
nr:hypothetical protein [Tanacetum cinerariifolium]